MIFRKTNFEQIVFYRPYENFSEKSKLISSKKIALSIFKMLSDDEEIEKTSVHHTSLNRGEKIWLLKQRRQSFYYKNTYKVIISGVSLKRNPIEIYIDEDEFYTLDIGCNQTLQFSFKGTEAHVANCVQMLQALREKVANRQPQDMDIEVDCRPEERMWLAITIPWECEQYLQKNPLCVFGDVQFALSHHCAGLTADLMVLNEHISIFTDADEYAIFQQYETRFRAALKLLHQASLKDNNSV